VRDDKLIFKAEIVADTPDVIYLEGVDVDPDERGKGHGSRCMAQLCRELLGRTRSIALLVNEKSPRAAAFYTRAGFKLIEYYDTIFLQRKYN
jgi:predicted GNAT family acetyltransferase